MSIAAPSRLLLLSLRQRPQSQCHRLAPLCQQYRSFSGDQKRNSADLPNRTKETTKQSEDGLPAFKSGKLAPSIFDTVPEAAPSERKGMGERGPEGRKASQGLMTEKKEAERISDEKVDAEGGAKGMPNARRITRPKAKIFTSYKDLKPTIMNPKPKAIIRFERKMVIRDVRRRHRLNRTEKLLRTERFHSARSPFVKTSIKKMGPLARQIAGKPVEEAMVQMRFSKKKAAQDVLKHLKYVRDQAVVAKGMGLGKDVAESVELPKKTGLEAKLEKEGKVVVEDKEGKRRIVTDRSAMYVDEAWVGRGAYQFGTDYRARGRGNRLRLPYTSISIVLKEEATRMRLQEEREQKRLKKPVWVPLPDRPITAQRQYPLW